MLKAIKTLYFSPTGTSEKTIKKIANTLVEKLNREPLIEHIDFTLPGIREKALSFNKEELILVALPVYAGRVPNVLLDFLNKLEGNGARALAVVLYGNRNYDDALIELCDILENRNFSLVAGAAFIGEHSFSKTLGGGRPDADDLKIAEEFALKVYEKIKSGKTGVEVKGNRPYKAYYKPTDEEGKPTNILKVAPKTDLSLCIDCKLCAENCPMGSIDMEDVSKVEGICIKCCSCVKKCPVEAKYFDDKNYLWHKEDLERNFTHIRREVELFI